MGFLDDAIREHLDLKRRRGADPGEIERLEREALGPVRRTPHETQDVLPNEHLASRGLRDDLLEANGGELAGDAPFVDHGSDWSEREESEDWEEPRREPVGGGIGVEPDTAAPAIPAPPPAAATAPGGFNVERDYLEQETVEHDVEGEEFERGMEPAGPQPGAADPEGPEADDMLEETPDFLQDTPDHDRLWFEQRPPRDFDLDG